MKLITSGNTPPPNDDAREPDEYIPNPNLHLKLNVEKSKAYVKHIIGKMSATEALKFIHDQVLTKNLLLNDAIIKQLEALEEEKNFIGKAAIAQLIQTLTAVSTEITSNKLALEKALGAHLLPHLPETAANPNPQTKEMGAEDFNEAYAQATRKN